LEHYRAGDGLGLILSRKLSDQPSRPANARGTHVASQHTSWPDPGLYRVVGYPAIVDDEIEVSARAGRRDGEVPGKPVTAVGSQQRARSAPISTDYSQLVIGEARRRFPGVPIKAVVTTSDSWPHFAEIRQYVANDIPIYSLDLNIASLSRNAVASYSSKPDLQKRLHRRPLFRSVAHPMTIGTGANRLELLPIRGQTTERQMLVYFPAYHLLYGSDAFQRDPSGAFALRQSVDEVIDAAIRERLLIDRFYMMHVGPTEWSALEMAPVNTEIK
jgi:hypothetical protein